jgi:ADP-ribosylglycohydrolase
MTCLSALHAGHPGTVSRPVNNSKGCGGVMRVAPAGLAGGDPFSLSWKVATSSPRSPTTCTTCSPLAGVRMASGIAP